MAGALYGIFQSKDMKFICKYIGMFILVVLVMIAACEGVTALFLSHPKLTQMIPSTYSYFKDLYMLSVRNVIQFTDKCSQYHPELTYTLRPGTFVFSNMEFKNRFSVNRSGVRDDEDSLNKPEIVVLGDSFAMGWGVEQDETYAQIIEKKTGHNVLNAAVSSYGTVRELMMLNHIDTSNLKYLIIHYVTNDFDENRSYYSEGNRLLNSDEQAYEATVQSLKQLKAYHFGKYTKYFLIWIKERLKLKIQNWRKLAPSTQTHERPLAKNTEEARLFLNALTTVPKMDLSNVEIIVLGDNNFIPLLQDALSGAKQPLPFKKIAAIELTSKMDWACYYILDDHYTAQGHAVIADELMKEIKFES